MKVELNTEMETSNSRLKEIEALNLEAQKLEQEIQRLRMDVSYVIPRIPTEIHFGFFFHLVEFCT